jgi:hypothetical protein
MLRHLEPELLDTLPPSDPEAVHSRRDLRLLNLCMGHSRIVAGQLQRAFLEKPPRHLVDLGGGDGTFLLNVCRVLGSRWQGVEVLIVDRHNVLKQETREEFVARGWRVQLAEHEAMDYLERRTSPFCDAMIANLVLHHFSDAELQRLFQCARHCTSLFLAVEPRRSRLALLFSHAVWLIGGNAVTRHDAPASVLAGFQGSELSNLWPPNEGWSLEERPVGLFSHLFQTRCLLR